MQLTNVIVKKQYSASKNQKNKNKNAMTSSQMLI
jgi:hypothetical protein